MRSAVLAIGVLAGCGRSSYVDQLEHLADQACDCRSYECAYEVTERVADARRQAELDRSAGKPLDGDEQVRLSASVERLVQCLDRHTPTKRSSRSQAK